MDEEKQKRHLYMVIGDIGLLFLGLAVLRLIVILDDVIGQWLVFLGIWCVLLYQRYLVK
ncbi:hypothetical protein ACFO3D_08830 [Virgibacillus kekensis]|uniref:Uncharacterized protein n=1 Tax=Virgibacillus kekensis TaxID=202261 RepID=A0ABV9DHK6_9BACI